MRWPPIRLGLDVPTVAGSLAIAVGITVLFGWLLGLDVLKSIIPGLLTMKVNTALAFVLLGTGLFLSARAGTARDRRLAILPVAAALILAAVTSEGLARAARWRSRRPDVDVGRVGINLEPDASGSPTALSLETAEPTRAV